MIVRNIKKEAIHWWDNVSVNRSIRVAGEYYPEKVTKGRSAFKLKNIIHMYMEEKRK